MKKLTKTITIQEACELAEKDQFLNEFLGIFPNNAGINLCAVKDITFKCTDDEYGQLTDLQVTFIPADQPEKKGNPWLKRLEDGSGVEYNVV